MPFSYGIVKILPHDNLHNKVNENKLHELLSLYIKNFNCNYIQDIYNIISKNKNIEDVYKFIKKYIIHSKKNIITCIKKNRFSIDELVKFINNFKTKFIFIKNFDKNFNNNINRIIFNNIIINPNICMIIFKNIITNNIKFIYYLQKILKSAFKKYNNSILNDYNLDFFQNSFIKYIFENIMLKINSTNNILNDYKLIYYYIENDNNIFNIYSKLFNKIKFKNVLYNHLIKKYINEINKNNYMFIVNNLIFLSKIIKSNSIIEDTILLKKQVLKYTIENINLYNIKNDKFFTFYFELNDYIIQNNKYYKLSIIKIFQKNPMILNKFIQHTILMIYNIMTNSNLEEKYNILIKIINNINILFKFNEIFKIKFMNIFKNTNNIFLLDKLVNKNNLINFNIKLKKMLMFNINSLSEYIYNIYIDYYKSTKDNICINPYYWNINNNNYIKLNSDKKFKYLGYLHFGKTIINFEYMNNIINLTMLPIQYEMFKHFNENNIFPKKIGNYSKDYLNKVIQSFINSKLILYNDNTYNINSDFKQINTNLIEVFYTNEVKDVKKQNAIDIKYVIAANINKCLKHKSNDINGIYQYLKEVLNIDIFNISRKNISDTLDYMIKQDYIYKIDNMYKKILY